jgi:hypothetical protein
MFAQAGILAGLAAAAAVAAAAVVAVAVQRRRALRVADQAAASRRASENDVVPFNSDVLPQGASPAPAACSHSYLAA